jgi:hypothetical protein
MKRGRMPRTNAWYIYAACGATVQRYSLIVIGAMITLHSPFGTCHRVVELQSLLLAPEVGIFLVSHP